MRSINTPLVLPLGEITNTTDEATPLSLFTSTEALWGLVTDEGDLAPNPAFVYRLPGSDQAEGDTAAGVAVSYRGTSVTHVWSPEVGGYLRTQNDSAHVDEDGVQVAPTNVVVQFVQYRASGQVDSAGAVVPEAVLEGSGEVWVLMDGVVVMGTWTKANVTSPASYSDANGSVIELAPGSTWVLLPEPGSAELL